MEKNPPSNAKAWLAPGIIIALVTIVLSFTSAYIGKQRADAETQIKLVEYERRLSENEKRCVSHELYDQFMENYRSDARDQKDEINKIRDRLLLH